MIKRLIVWLICISILSQICSCGVEQGSYSDAVSNETTPEITIIVTPEARPDSETEESVEEQNEPEDVPIVTDEDIESLVYGAVTYSLESAGFTCNTGIARSLNESGYTASGLYYYSDEFPIFNNDDIKAVGFLEVVNEDDPYVVDPIEAEDIIGVESLDSDADVDLICTYNYENIGSSHFVYGDKYIKYYQQSPMRVVYSVEDNLIVNYDLSLGSLYDYDNEEYIFDESIWGSYTTHSAVELFSETDYQQLETDLQELSDQQVKNGYIVNEYKIVYISPESIQAYLDSEEEGTFFGYSVSALTEAFGLGKALEYTDDGFQAADYLQEERENDLDNYNWKRFLTKLAVGSGIIIVGAILTPVTGGASFGCALLTITSGTLSAAFSGALTTLAVQTVKGLINHKTLKDAILDARVAGLNAFANGFVIGAAISSIGVASGIIKPAACFAEGTVVAVPGKASGIDYIPIEKIHVGDYVYAFDQQSGSIRAQTVTDVTKRYVTETVQITVNGETIITTPSHPFYSANGKDWIPAGILGDGDKLFGIDGAAKTIGSVDIAIGDKAIPVYNLTVDSSHTYFVGNTAVLVHNSCNTIDSMRSKAVKDAWHKEVEAVKSGTSKYNWSPDEIRQLLSTGKVKGYQGHHIRTVRELIGTADEALIGSADDIVFLAKENHVYLHALGDTFSATQNRLVELVPWVVERFQLLNLVA